MRYMIRCLVLAVLVIILAVPASAATVEVYPFGTAKVTVPVDQYINVFSAGASAKVYKTVGGPASSSVARFQLETSGTVTNQETSFGPYTIATVVKIEAGADPVFYSVGAAGLKVPVTRPLHALTPSSGSIFRVSARIGQLQPVPTAMTTAATITSAALLTGIITGTHSAGATAAYTLPTGTLLEAAAPQLQIGEGFEWVLINLSTAAADSITVTAGTDHTIVGAPVVISSHVTTGGSITSMGCNSSTWITKKTAANTFVTYRKN